MKCAAYLRVSSDQQSVDNQLPAIEQWVKSRDGELVEVYSENESAWKQGHQRELARLLDDLRSGRRKYDCLIIWALDRLSRQGSAAILNLVNTFHAYGVKVISIQETWTELPGELGEVLFAIAGWVSRMESERRSERVKAGIQRKMEKDGYRPGRQKGAKDRGKRVHTGYLLRYAKKSLLKPAKKSPS